MRVLFPTHLSFYTGGRIQIEGQGKSLAEVLAFVDARYPGLRFRIIDEQDRIRPHIKLFVNGKPANTLERPVAPDDEVQIIAALSGG